MKELKVAVIGLGNRGSGNLKTVLNSNPDVRVTALCDIYKDRMDAASKVVSEEFGQPMPFCTADYKEAIECENVNIVLIFTSWDDHIKIAIDAMEHGKITAMEVGGAKSVEECWALVDAYERTKTPFMFLENCCYGRDEMLVANMVRSGLLGKIVYAHGAYAHDLREEVVTGKEKRHYRLEHYLNINCENYPTHDLGPIAKILDINRGNRVVRMVSMASPAEGMEQYVNDRKDTIVNKELIGQRWKQGDVVTTMLQCANGELITLKLETTLPRSYSREFCIRGTKGAYEQNTNSVFIDGDTDEFDISKHYKEVIDNAKNYEKDYLPDMWANLTKEQEDAGHGGMDYFEFVDFFKRIQNDEPFPIDVYDAATWMSISPLSQESINNGSVPLEVPDFTGGCWKTRPRFDVI